MYTYNMTRTCSPKCIAAISATAQYFITQRIPCLNHTSKSLLQFRDAGNIGNESFEGMNQLYIMQAYLWRLKILECLPVVFKIRLHCQRHAQLLREKCLHWCLTQVVAHSCTTSEQVTCGVETKNKSKKCFQLCEHFNEPQFPSVFCAI